MPLAQAQHSAFAACVRELAKRDLAGKTTFQEGVRDLIAAGKREFGDLAKFHMELQVALAQSRAARLRFLTGRDRVDPAFVPQFPQLRRPAPASRARL